MDCFRVRMRTVLMLLATASAYGSSCTDSNASMVMLTLQSPWPRNLASLSRAATRAVRSTVHSNTSGVTFAAPAIECRRLLEAKDAIVRLEASSASEFYEARATADLADILSRRRLAGRSPGGPPEEALLGSMGGYYTTLELSLEMKRLARMYPSLISGPVRLGTSRQGRAIEVWCVTDQHVGCSGGGDRPAVLYTSLVHAREPATVMCLVHALRSFLRDASTNVAGASHLLRTRKLLFMPLPNPDGYAWNERRRPKGGGMKRKNGARTCNPVRPAESNTFRKPAPHAPAVCQHSDSGSHRTIRTRSLTRRTTASTSIVISGISTHMTT